MTRNTPLKNLLLEIFSPVLGSLWTVKNRFWKKAKFAINKQSEKVHPGLVISKEMIFDVCQIAPGTSKERLMTSGVFTAELDRLTSFLLYLAMPVHRNDFKEFDKGWWGKSILDDEELIRLKKQLEISEGKIEAE